MKIQEELSTLREALFLHAPDKKTGTWDDPFIYSVWKKYRAVAIRKSVSTINLQTFCLQLTSATSHDCDCIHFGCKVRKSIHPLPDTISGAFADNLRVSTLSGKTIGFMEDNERFSISLDPIKKQQRTFSLLNGHVLIWNDKDMKVITVRGPWADPMEWLEIHHCAGTGVVCPDAETLDAGLTEEQSAFVFNAVIRELIPGLQIQMNKRETAVDIHTEK